MLEFSVACALVRLGRKWNRKIKNSQCKYKYTFIFIHPYILRKCIECLLPFRQRRGQGSYPIPTTEICPPFILWVIVCVSVCAVPADVNLIHFNFRKTISELHLYSAYPFENLYRPGQRVCVCVWLDEKGQDGGRETVLRPYLLLSSVFWLPCLLSRPSLRTIMSLPPSRRHTTVGLGTPVAIHANFTVPFSGMFPSSDTAPLPPPSVPLRMSGGTTTSKCPDWKWTNTHPCTHIFYVCV